MTKIEMKIVRDIRRFLFISLVFSLLMAGYASAATISVCPSGCDYTTIQGAVDNAFGFDTINVVAGTYNENVIITTSDLTLQGAGIGQSIVNSLDGINSAFVVNNANSVVIDGFTVSNANMGNNAGIRFFQSLNSHVRNSEVKNNYMGIHLEGSYYNVIMNCQVNNNQNHGVYLSSNSYQNNLLNNIVSDNLESGIRIDSSNSNVIMWNNITNNKNGMEILDTIGGLISFNTMNMNQEHGMSLTRSDNIFLDFNNFLSNTLDGLRLYQSDDNGINTNLLEGNRAGISLDNSLRNSIGINTIYKNINEGIPLSSSNENNIGLNNITANGNGGIQIVNSINNQIYGNHLLNPIRNIEFVGSFVSNTWNLPYWCDEPDPFYGMCQGGNYYANPDGSGFSETCADADYDGICDMAYNLETGNVDNKPLTDYPGSSTPTGTNVGVNIGNARMTFDNVITEGDTVIRKLTGNVDPVPPNFKVNGQMFNITTTAVFSGDVTVCLPYDDAGMSLADENALKVLHYEGSSWVNKTVPPVDTVNNRVCGKVSSLSPFVVAAESQQGSGVGYGSGSYPCTGDNKKYEEFEGVANILFMNVITIGTGTTVTPSDTRGIGVGELPDGFTVRSQFVDISTDHSFDCKVLTCLAHNATGVEKSTLKMLHWDAAGGMWFDVTVSQESEEGYTCGLTTSFSPLVVVEDSYMTAPWSSEDPLDVSDLSGTNNVPALPAAGIVTLVGILGGIAIRRMRR